ncbi:MAG: NAD-dependent epimerase/dehydratase family protein [Anaerolineae bacterium]
MVEKLRERGAAHIFIPRRQDYDLVQREAALTLLHDARPDLIIHLAARVGGIGANLTHQAEYFYENLMMGTKPTWPVCPSSWLSAPFAATPSLPPSPSGKKTCGTATRDRPARPGRRRAAEAMAAGAA